MAAARFLTNPDLAHNYLSQRAGEALEFMLEGISTHAYARIDRIDGSWFVTLRSGLRMSCASPACGVAYILAKFH